LAGKAHTITFWRALLRELAAHLGLLDQDLHRVRTGGLRGSSPKSKAARRNAQAEDWIQDLVDQRSLAKKARDFPRADALREELAQAGIVLEDSPLGTRWRRA